MTTLNVGGIPIHVGENFIAWRSRLAVDLDGAPNAYAPRRFGEPLDYLANAGAPGNWYGLVCDANGEPFVQCADDPCPGYYVSCTALCDHAKLEHDPTRYVDASAVPYISIPRTLLKDGVKMGDVCSVVNYDNGATCAAIVADVGPISEIGEGSDALCRALGLRGGRLGGSDHSNIEFTIFLNSARGWPRTNEDVAAQVKELSTT